MPIKDELKKLTKIDIWSLMLFVLYNFQQIPEYAGISELAYVLDQKNLLKLCEYFGGQTITVPRVDDLQNLLYAMLLYQYIDVENMTEKSAEDMLGVNNSSLKIIKSYYAELKEVLSKYKFTHRCAI